MNPLGNLGNEVFFDCLFPFMEEANQCGYGRVENIDLYTRIGSVCRAWQIWVFSERGPFRSLKHDIICVHLEYYTKGMTHPLQSLRRAMGVLNQRLKLRSMEWFNCIERIKQDVKVKLPASKDYNPNDYNFNNETPFSIVVKLALEDKEKYGFLLEKLYEAGISADTIAKALPEIFSENLKAKHEDRLQLADDLIAKIKEMTKNRWFHAVHLQKQAGDILCINHDYDFSEPYSWLLMNGIKFTPDTLAECLSHGHLLLEDSFREIFSQIIKAEGFQVKGTLQDGDHLIHKLLGHNLSYLKILLEKAPEEIFVKDEDGKMFLWTVVNTRENIQISIDPGLFWKHRKKCHKVLLNNLRYSKIYKSRFNDERNTHALGYLKLIKQSFSSNEEFEKWLVDPHEDNESLLYQIAVWSPKLIADMLELKYITKEECLKEDSHGHTVQQLSELYDKFYRRIVSISEFKSLEILKKKTPLYFDPEGVGDLFMAFIYNKAPNATFTDNLIDDLIQLQGYDFIDKNGNTLLHRLLSPHSQCLIKTIKDAIDYLIDHDVDPEAVNNKNETALTLAESNGWEALGQFLLSKADRVLQKFDFDSQWFSYIKHIKTGQNVELPSSNPNVYGFNKETPFSMAVRLALKEEKKYGFLIEKLYEAGVSADSIAEALPQIFSLKFYAAPEARFGLADKLIEKIKAMTDNHCRPAVYLQEQVGEILCISDKDLLTPFKWLLKNDVKFTPAHLAYYLSHGHPDLPDSFEIIFSQIVNTKGFPIDETLKCGGHLIHKLLNGGQEYLKYLLIILQIAPQEIFAKDGGGKSFLWLLAEKIWLLAVKKGYVQIEDLNISKDLFWKHRAECHLDFLELLKHSKTTNYIFDDDNDALCYLNLIKQSFSSNEEFEKWLVNSHDDNGCLLHHIAIWSPTLIQHMLEHNYITKQECLRTDCHGRTVLHLSEMYKKFYNREFKPNDFDFIENIKKETPLFFDPENLFMTHFFSDSQLKFSGTLVDGLLKIVGYNLTDTKGNTLLHRLMFVSSSQCSLTRMKEAIAYLIDHGVDPHIVNNHKKTASMLAKKNGWSELLPMLQ